MVVKELLELQLRIKKLVKEDYSKINQILIESNSSLLPVVEGVLYSFFGEDETGSQVYVIIDQANEKGFYCSNIDEVKVYEEKKGITTNGEFERWLNGE